MSTWLPEMVIVGAPSRSHAVVPRSDARTWPVCVLPVSPRGGQEPREGLSQATVIGLREGTHGHSGHRVAPEEGGFDAPEGHGRLTLRPDLEAADAPHGQEELAPPSLRGLGEQIDASGNPPSIERACPMLTAQLVQNGSVIRPQWLSFSKRAAIDRRRPCTSCGSA